GGVAGGSLSSHPNRPAINEELSFGIGDTAQLIHQLVWVSLWVKCGSRACETCSMHGLSIFTISPATCCIRRAIVATQVQPRNRCFRSEQRYSDHNGSSDWAVRGCLAPSAASAC